MEANDDRAVRAICEAHDRGGSAQHLLESIRREDR